MLDPPPLIPLPPYLNVLAVIDQRGGRSSTFCRAPIGPRGVIKRRRSERHPNRAAYRMRLLGSDFSAC